MRLIRCVVSLAMVIGGCASARADFHAAVSSALGVVVAAQNDPALLEESKALLNAAAGKALTPVDAALVTQALNHVNAGSLGTAQTILSPLASASAGP